MFMKFLLIKQTVYMIKSINSDTEKAALYGINTVSAGSCPRTKGYGVQRHLSIFICLFRGLYISAVVVGVVVCTLCLIWDAFSNGMLTSNYGYMLHWNPSRLSWRQDMEISHIRCEADGWSFLSRRVVPRRKRWHMCHTNESLQKRFWHCILIINKAAATVCTVCAVGHC